MAAGFIPVVGEIADIALIIYYLYKGENLYAALMLIALVPTVGDILIKPFIKTLKAAKTETAIAVKLAENPQMAAKVAELAKSPAVEKTIEGLSKVNMSWGQKLREGLSSLTRFPVVGGAKAGIDSIKTGGKFSTGLKNFFRNEKLASYVTKHGMEPQSFISKWWLNVSARTARKNAFRKFIMANNLLAKFGIPSLTTFEEKIATDAEFRKKLAEDPQFGQYVGQDMTPEEFNGMRGGEERTSGGAPNAISTLYGLGMLKTLAKMYA
jgi:hypothetical protein